jgi:hypothetical protein
MCLEWPGGGRGRIEHYIRGFIKLATLYSHGYFIINLEEEGLFDIKLEKLTPTWRNKRIGERTITKRIDHFLISKGFLD